VTPKTDAWEDVRFWLARLDDPCFVYVIRAGGPIKVGVAKDVAARLATLQTGNPYRFDLLAVLPGAHDLEWQLHRRIESDRLEGEWFDGPQVPAFLEFVAELATKMRHAYADDGAAPHWKRLIGTWKYKRTTARQQAEVTVRYIEPNPLSPDEVAARREKRRRESVRNGERLHRYAKHLQKTPD
jgi:hypothetical protein